MESGLTKEEAYDVVRSNDIVWLWNSRLKAKK